MGEIATALGSSDQLENAIATQLVAQSCSLQQNFGERMPRVGGSPLSIHTHATESNEPQLLALPLSQMRLLALENSVEFSDDAMHLVVSALADANALCREHACLVAAGIGCLEPSLHQDILSLTNDPDRYVRAAAAFALRVTGVRAPWIVSGEQAHDRFARLVACAPTDFGSNSGL